MLKARVTGVERGSPSLHIISRSSEQGWWNVRANYLAFRVICSEYQEKSLNVRVIFSELHAFFLTFRVIFSECRANYSDVQAFFSELRAFFFKFRENNSEF